MKALKLLNIGNDGKLISKVWSHFNQTLFQLIDVACTLLIHPLLKIVSNFTIIYWVQIGAVSIVLLEDNHRRADGLSSAWLA